MKAKPAKSVKPAKSAKPTSSAGKTAAKTTMKAAVKAAVKTTMKANVKAKTPSKVVKPGARPALKVAVKPIKTVKPPVKAKPAVKKPAVKKPTVKKPTVKKPTVKKPVVKTATKPVAKKPLSKAQSAVKAAGKPAVQAAPQKLPVTASKVLAKVAPKTTQPAATAKAKTTPVGAAVPLAAPKPAPIGNGLPPPPPLKPGRRSSSRALAHMPPPAPMVPTHAPDAAKASYSTMTERVIAPPPHVAAKKDPKLANNWKTKTPETLTEEEVNAMPDVEYMNDMQMAFFRHKLSILKQDIHNSAGATTEHLREDTVVVPDPADRATIEEEHALELRTRDRERKLLKKIEQSIARIDSGDYGYCDETGEPIGVGRLMARPTASLSLEAQQRRELKQKMFGD
ncbi:MAG: RNA polymerase-binding protein DksA [Polaromonas sp.]